MTTALHERACSDCKPGTPPLRKDEIQRLVSEIDSGWKIEDAVRIKKVFDFRDFRGPFALATHIALIAESQGHHPDLLIEWGKLTVTLTTHVAKGLTENDFIMAARIDRLKG